MAKVDYVREEKKTGVSKRTPRLPDVIAAAGVWSTTIYVEYDTTCFRCLCGLERVRLGGEVDLDGWLVKQVPAIVKAK